MDGNRSVGLFCSAKSCCNSRLNSPHLSFFSFPKDEMRYDSKYHILENFIQDVQEVVGHFIESVM